MNDKKYIAKRKKNFSIKVKTERFPDVPEEKKVSITHNGYQWQALLLSPNEARKLITQLEKFATPAKNLKYNGIDLDIFSCDICGFALSEHGKIAC